MSGNPAICFSQEFSPSPMHPRQLMTARTRLVSQTIIGVEAKSLDDSIGGVRRQASLPIVGRGPAVLEEDVPGCNLTLDNHLSRASRGL